MIVGRPKSRQHVELVNRTEESLRAGMKAVKGGIRVGDISSAIEKVLNKYHYGIVRELVGHGVGHHLHEDPNIPNYGRPGTGPWLKTNMTIAIEPMSTLGTDRVKLSNDGWTVVTADGSMSAHFEHTIILTDEGFEIITA
jgi:methionyl aminopeptidase